MGIEKLIVAVVGNAIAWLSPMVMAKTGIDVSGIAPVVVQGVVYALTAFGVYQVPNKA